MSVDPNWLKNVRQKNRVEFGMAGVGGLGAYDSGAQSVASTLTSARMARASRAAEIEERASAIRINETMASDPRTAALMTAPEMQIPQAGPLQNKGLLIGGAVVAVGLLAFILWRS